MNKTILKKMKKKNKTRKGRALLLLLF
jgi:hypothetical protein